MFLRPQHLQQQSLYFESLITQQLRSASPFLWGVRALELDEDALAARRIQVKVFEAVLPDGTFVRNGDNVTIEARQFEASAVPLDVWVGLRRARVGESASAMPDEARRDVRYRIHAQSVEDHNRPDSKTGIDFLVPNLRLYLSGEKLEVEQCEAIKIARIVPSSDKKKIFEAATDYAPPLLVLQASSALTSAMEEVLSLLEGRIPVVSSVFRPCALVPAYQAEGTVGAVVMEPDTLSRAQEHAVGGVRRLLGVFVLQLSQVLCELARALRWYRWAIAVRGHPQYRGRDVLSPQMGGTATEIAPQRWPT
jgi:type VI secretion system ImpJ/VasE family protein